MLPDGALPDGLDEPPDGEPEGAPEGLVERFCWFVVLPALPDVEPEDAELPAEPG